MTHGLNDEVGLVTIKLNLGILQDWKKLGIKKFRLFLFIRKEKKIIGNLHMHLVRQVWVGGGDRIHMFGRRENGEEERVGGRGRIHMFDMGKKEIEWEQRGNQ